jgi:hypothetical protein
VCLIVTNVKERDRNREWNRKFRDLGSALRNDFLLLLLLLLRYHS